MATVNFKFRLFICFCVFNLMMSASIFNAYSAEPVKAILSSPYGTIQDSTPIFTWSDNFSNEWYKLWIENENGDKLFSEWVKVDACDGSKCNVTTQIELPDADYVWYVKSWTEDGKVWSNAMYFTIQSNNSQPSKVTHISPSGTIQDSTPTFTWNESDFTDWYKLWIGYPNSAKLIASWHDAANICVDGICTVTIQTELIDDDYEWYVKSWSEDGKVWSDGMSFSVAGDNTNTGNQRKWVLVGEPVINENNLPLEYYGGGTTHDYYVEERFRGKWEIYSVSETSISKDAREVDRGFEYFATLIESTFDAPPRELIPGQLHSLSVNFTKSGTVHSYPPSATFEYRADKTGSIQPYESFTYAPWHQGFTGENSKTWSLTVPEGKSGATLEIYAFWWNCPVCDITWRYQME